MADPDEVDAAIAVVATLGVRDLQRYITAKGGGDSLAGCFEKQDLIALASDLTRERARKHAARVEAVARREAAAAVREEALGTAVVIHVVQGRGGRVREGPGPRRAALRAHGGEEGAQTTQHWNWRRPRRRRLCVRLQ